MDKKQYIEAGRIVNTHGVRGEVKIEVWLDSAEFLRSFKRVFIGEREIKIESAFVHKGFLVAKLEGVDDVNAAMTFKGREISILRADAKKQEQILEAQGRAEAILTVQRATAEGIRLINESMPSDAVIKLKSLEAFAAAADGRATKIIIPSEIQGVAALAAGLVESVKGEATNA